MHISSLILLELQLKLDSSFIVVGQSQPRSVHYGRTQMAANPASVGESYVIFEESIRPVKCILFAVTSPHDFDFLASHGTARF